MRDSKNPSEYWKSAQEETNPKIHQKLVILENGCNTCFEKEGKVSDGPFNCSNCDKSFESQTHLTNHQKDHKDENTFSCPKCRKMSMSSDNIQTHCNEKPFNCSVCECEINSSIHEAEKQFRCTSCHKNFANENLLKSHENEHAQEPFRCSKCDKTFADQNLLITHENDHAEEPFRCSHCGKNFANRNLLKIHENKHKEEPFRCSNCDKNFADQNLLKIHENEHGVKSHLVAINAVKHQMEPKMKSPLNQRKSLQVLLMFSSQPR